jgi:hypothetical protein
MSSKVPAERENGKCQEAGYFKDFLLGVTQNLKTQRALRKIRREGLGAAPFSKPVGEEEPEGSTLVATDAKS